MLHFCFLQVKLSKSLDIGRFTFTELYKKTGIPKMYLHSVLNFLSSKGLIKITEKGADRGAWRSIEMPENIYRLINQLEIFNFP